LSESTLPIDPNTRLACQSNLSMSWTARPGLAIALWTTFLLVLGLLGTGLASRADLLYTLGTLGFFTLPGYFVAPLFFGRGPGVRAFNLIVGALIGIALSSYGAIVAGYLYGWSPKAITSAIVGSTVLCAVLGRLFRGRFELQIPTWNCIDSAILAALGIVLLVFTALPALRVGKLTSHGYAYTWLYGIDFLYRSDVITAMVAKMPPDLFWMTGIPLRMYLLGYAAPAYAFAISGKAISMHSLVLLTTLFTSFLMLGCVYIWLRTLFSETKVLVGTLFVILFAYSYYWTYAAVKAVLMKPGLRFQFYDSVSHLFQRTFLVEPQAAIATSLLLIILTLMALSRYRLNNFGLAIFIGISLGISFGIEATESMIVIAWFGIFYVLRFLFAQGKLRDEYVPFAATVASCGLICGSYFLLGMYQPSTSHLVKFEPNLWILKYGLAYFPVEFGPLLFLGVAGIVWWWRGRREEFGWPIVVMAVTVMANVLLVVPKPVTRMADRLLPVVLIVFTAYAIRELLFSKHQSFTRVLAGILIIAAIPTFFTDIYYASNVNDIYNTRYVAPVDKEACDWIRKNLPQAAVVQGDYNYFTGGPERGLYLSLISSFGERPQVLGWFSGAAILVDNGWNIAKERRADVTAMMNAADLTALLPYIREYQIDYIYVGPFEQGRHPQFLPILQGAPDVFQRVYSKDGVIIFRYLGMDSTRQPAPSGS
jgi:hypothetical protein